MTHFSIDQQVSFGDCDPAGIVFYPNFFAWIDRCFHALMREKLGGHAGLCRDMGAQGFGLMDAAMNFRAPVGEGDLLHLEITGITWANRSFTVSYRAHVGERLIFQAQEVRGVFIRDGGRMRAGDVAPLKARFAQVGVA